MIYEIAGLRIKLQPKFDYTEKFCRAYLSEDQTSPVDLTAEVTPEEFAAEKEASARFFDGYIENICLYRSICLQLPKFNRFLLHSSVLEYDGVAYAFLGKSGTGKSTHTRLWLQNIENTRVINGDKPIIAFENGKFTVYSTPWQGKENWGCKSQATLKGLCFLEQAKENSIVKLKNSETTSRIFTQILLPTEEENAVAMLDLMDKLVTDVPAYLLRCDISETAVKTSYEALTGKKYI